MPHVPRPKLAFGGAGTGVGLTKLTHPGAVALRLRSNIKHGCPVYVLQILGDYRQVEGGVQKYLSLSCADVAYPNLTGAQSRLPSLPSSHEIYSLPSPYLSEFGGHRFGDAEPPCPA